MKQKAMHWATFSENRFLLSAVLSQYTRVTDNRSDEYKNVVKWHT